MGNRKEKSSLFTPAVNLSEKARVNSQLIALSNVLQVLSSRVNREYHSTRSASQLQWCFGSTQFCWRPQAHCLLPRRAPPQWVCTCPSPRPPTHQLRGALSVAHKHIHTAQFTDLHWKFSQTIPAACLISIFLVRQIINKPHLVNWRGVTSCSGRPAPARSALIGQ